MTEVKAVWDTKSWPEAPAGVGPGDVPHPVAWSTRVCIVLPPTSGTQDRQYSKRLRTHAKDRGFAEPAMLRTHEQPNAFKEKFRLLRVSDVKGLYLGAHRERVIVVALTGGRVLLDPTEIPDRRNTVSIQEYVRYKCAYMYVENQKQLEAAFALINEYPAASSCESPRDPRCLPFSIFAAKTSDDLDTTEGRQGFARRHNHARSSSDLADAKDRLWQRQEYHSSDLIHVAGMTLPIGFHWNVQAQRSTTFANGWERWDLMRGGYTNVHPDANVRGGQRATRTYAASSPEQPARARPSKRVRSSRGSFKGRQNK